MPQAEIRKERTKMRNWTGWLAAFGVMAFLGACSSIDRDEQDCLKVLDEQGVTYEKIPDWTTSEGCGVAWAVQVKSCSSSIDWNNPVKMSCPLAKKIWEFETRVVEPAARDILKQPVAKIHHYGAYSCRNVIGGNVNRLSEHSKGMAFDIGIFQLADGGRISVSKDWRDKGPKGQFLRRVAKEACSVFPLVLSPNYNKAHWDHLHLDIGPYGLCGV